MSLQLKSYNFLIQDTFSRIEKGIPYSVNLKTYTKEFVEKILKYFEEKEEFEKCFIIHKFLQERFQHENNYFNKE
jgi:hypothetical protein